MKKMLLTLCVLVLAGCAGMKVINPNDQNKNEGTLALDTTNGFKLVATYTCKLDSMGNRFSAIGKSEAEARDEVVARCRDKSVISFCKPEKATCIKN